MKNEIHISSLPQKPTARALLLPLRNAGRWEARAEPRAKLGHVEDPTAPVNVVHDERWQERGAFGDGGRGVAEMTESRLRAAPNNHSGRWQRRALEPHVQLPRREHFDNDAEGGARIGNPYKHYGRWEMRATFGDGRPFYGPLKDAPGPDVDGAPDNNDEDDEEVG